MKKNNSKENFLEKVPVRKNGIGWSQGDDGMVTLEMENKGIANRIAQKLLKKPKLKKQQSLKIKSLSFKNFVKMLQAEMLKLLWSLQI